MVKYESLTATSFGVRTQKALFTNRKETESWALCSRTFRVSVDLNHDARTHGLRLRSDESDDLNLKPSVNETHGNYPCFHIGFGCCSPAALSTTFSTLNFSPKDVSNVYESCGVVGRIDCWAEAEHGLLCSGGCTRAALVAILWGWLLFQVECLHLCANWATHAQVSAVK